MEEKGIYGSSWTTLWEEYSMKKFAVAAGFAAALMSTTAIQAAELEVTHWWTSGGEAAAVAEFARAFEEAGHTWIDGAIAGGSGAAEPVIIGRIIGNDPMGATMMNTGRDGDELVEAGLMLELTALAEEEGWADFINPPSLLDNCVHEGGIYCVPVNIHSWQWMWVSHKAFEDAGVPVPTNWEEFVAAAPALREAGKIPLAMGQQPWQSSGAFGVIAAAIGGLDWWRATHEQRDSEALHSDTTLEVWQAFADARELSSGSNVQDWNQATNMVIQGQAGAQIMGDWAQGEFQVAGQVAGEDYSCLPGLGHNEVISTGGDSFYFPKQDDPEVEAAQLELASLLVSREVQVAFNLKKGSLPVRGDIDLEAANDCMKKGLEILASGDILPDGNQLWGPATQTELNDLLVEFFFDPSISAEEGMERWVSIIENAPA